MLEREYLRRVERAHGLPEGVRQRPSSAGGRPSYRDVRLTYGLVLGSPCRTAARLAVLLQRGGWSGELRRCERCDVRS